MLDVGLSVVLTISVGLWAAGKLLFRSNSAGGRRVPMGLFLLVATGLWTLALVILLRPSASDAWWLRSGMPLLDGLEAGLLAFALPIKPWKYLPWIVGGFVMAVNTSLIPLADGVLLPLLQQGVTNLMMVTSSLLFSWSRFSTGYVAKPSNLVSEGWFLAGIQVGIAGQSIANVLIYFLLDTPMASLCTWIINAGCFTFLLMHIALTKATLCYPNPPSESYSSG